MLSTTLNLGLILTLTLLPSTHSHANPQITTAPSPSDYTSALARDSFLLRLKRKEDSTTSLGSADALSYCQESVAGCSTQLPLYHACESKYGDDPKYLYCLCTTGYHSAVSQCDACSVSLGALAASQLSLDKSDAETQCASLSSRYGGQHTSTTKAGTHTGTGTKGGGGGGGGGDGTTKTAEAEATSTIPSSTTTTSSVVTMPTEPYAGLAGQPTIPGDGNGVAAPTSSQGAAAAGSKGAAGVVAGVVVCAVLL